MNQLKDSTINNCIKLASESLSVSVETGRELTEQDDQINRAVNMSSDIKHNVSKANRILNRLKSYVGFMRAHNKDNTHEYRRIPTNLITSPVDDNTCLLADPEDEYDTLLKLTTQLKEINTDISKKLDDQNQSLLVLESNLEDNCTDLKLTNRTIKKLIR